MKKIVIIALIILFIIIMLFKYYDSQKTVECWWGTIYPTLSFVGFEDTDGKEQEKTAKISASDKDYIYFKEAEEKPIKIKFILFELFKKFFKEE